MENNFFGSKFYNSRLNTILLFVLIVLMIIAIRIMLQNKEVYFPFLNENIEKQEISKNIGTSKDDQDGVNQSDEFIKENILGIWAKKGEINSNFLIDKNNIIYTDEENAKYSYSVINGYMIIKGEDFENKYLVIIPEKGSLILEDNTGEKSIFYTFKN